MIKIDLANNDSGSFGGEIPTLIEEYSRITGYMYQMYKQHDPRNIGLFDELINLSKERSEDFEDAKNMVVKDTKNKSTKER